MPGPLENRDRRPQLPGSLFLDALEIQTMKCPIDGEMLIMSERSGVEVDYCPKCRGVWLDRGELDKIIERSGADTASGTPSRPVDRQPRDHDRGHAPRRKKSESFLSELFDF